MMGLLIALALALDPSAEIPQDALDSVVLMVQDGHTCAGAVVSDTGDVLTSYHCVVGGRRVRVETRSGLRHTGRVVRTDRSRDLAIVAVPTLAGAPALRIATESPDIGAAVWALGHPYAGGLPAGFFAGTLRFSASGGNVSAVGSEAVQTTAPINPGNSGGPLVLDETGDIVGVVSRRVGRDGVGFAGRVRDEGVVDGYGPLGGRITVEPVAMLDVADDAAFSVGGRLGVSLRDRIWLRGDVLLPIDSRWDAVRFGTSRYTRAQGALTVQQPILRGTTPVSVGAHVGVAARTVVRGQALPVRLTRDTRAAVVLGGGVSAFGMTVEVSAVQQRAGWGGRLALTLGVPGTVSVW